MWGCRASVVGRVAAVGLALAVDLAWAGDPFTIVALPDSQDYVGSAALAPLFKQQTQWIADQIQSPGNPRNIRFVTHVGDVVDDGDDATQWQRADAAMGLLDGVVGYSTAVGNHDLMSAGDKYSGAAGYVDAFGPSRFAGEAWYGGADPSGFNSFQRFSAGGYEFLHLSLEWLPADNTPYRVPSPIAWAQSVLDANPDTPAIVTTHEYLGDSLESRSIAGEELWDQLVRRNDQVFMVLSGHYSVLEGGNSGEYFQVSSNNAGRPVVEIMQDFQDYPNGGDGWFRLIGMDIPNNRIEVQTYSPVLDAFQTETVAEVGGHASQFEVAMDFSTRLVPSNTLPLPVPDLVFRQQSAGGYSGTQEKELRESGGDSSIGQDGQVTIRGGAGSATQGLVRFDDIIGSGIEQIAPGAEIGQALLVLDVYNAGSGFAVHEMLSAWDEGSTWAGLVDGVQADGVEAVVSPVATVGADNADENVPMGELVIDVTATVRAYLEGTLPNLGWALLPFANGTDDIAFFTSEFDLFDASPQLQIFYDQPGDYDGDRDVDVADLMRVQRNGTAEHVALWREHFGTGGGGGSATVVVPEPGGLCLAIVGVFLGRRRLVGAK